MLSMAVLILSSILFPPAKQPPKPAAAPGAAQEDADRKLAADGAQPAAEAPAGDAATDGSTAEQIEIDTASEPPLEYLTLGSLDPDSGYRMLVTLTNKGAAVYRAE